jgi:hypothetical protein
VTVGPIGIIPKLRGDRSLAERIYYGAVGTRAES